MPYSYCCVEGMAEAVSSVRRRLDTTLSNTTFVLKRRREGEGGRGAEGGERGRRKKGR